MREEERKKVRRMTPKMICEPIVTRPTRQAIDD